jgi:hypothetical protein
MSEHIHSWLGGAADHSAEIIGLFNLDRTTNLAFSDDELALVQTCAHAASDRKRQLI